MKHYWAKVVAPSEEIGISLTTNLRSKCRFKINECYFTTYKAAFNEFYDCDFFRIDLITQNDRKNAERIMNRAIDLLSYITNAPYELDELEEDSNINITPININSRKIENLKEINDQYKSIRRKKELLENTLRMYSLALKYDMLLGDCEESFFILFRIIEKIAKDEFRIEKESIDIRKSDMRTIIKRIIEKSYGIKMTSEKLDSFAGKLSNKLFNDVFSEVYSIIAWFCRKKNIKYDENVLSKAVSIRNRLAHGEYVHIDSWSEEYNLVRYLANMCIRKKFFRNIQHWYLKVDISSY